MKQQKPVQKPMFENGEDSPLFSGTCQRVEVNPFKPQIVGKQFRMFEPEQPAKVIK